MKMHLSVLMLFMRCTLYKFLLLVLVMAAAESAFFALALRGAKGFFGLDTILAACRPGLICAVCFLMLCALLCLTGCEFGGRHGYTLSRLRVSPRAVFLWQAVNNAGLLFLFWAAQVGIVLAFCAVYTARYNQPQAAMLVFYQNDFLHSLLPLSDWSRLVGNLAMIISLAFTTACFPVRMRRGEKPMAVFVLAVFCLRHFTQEMGSPAHDLAFTAMTLVIAFFAVSAIWKEEKDEALS